MKPKTIQGGWFLVWLYLLLVVACQPISTTITLFTATPIQSIEASATIRPRLSPTLTPTPALWPTIPFMPTSTETLTPIPTNTAIPSPVNTLTPLPTLSPDEAMAEVQRLYETNNGCLLPCWWGIVLGQTDWRSTQRFFETFASRIIEPFEPPTEPLWGVEIFWPEIFAPHRYRIYGDIIIEMEGYIEMTPLFDPTTILATYGPPSEVRFSASVGGDTDGMTLFVFYPQHGFLLQYQIGEPNAEVANGVLHGCFVDATTYLVVWPPTETFTLSERLENTTQFNYYDHIPGRPLEEATGMTIETFYQTFQNAEPPLCLETPNSLWPGY